MAFCHPAYDLYIAQAAGAFLDIWFEVISGVVKTQVTTALFFEFGFEKFAR